MNWADELILEYKDGKRALRGVHKALDDFPEDQQDKSKINSMIGDMDFSIEWMETGRQPGTYKGAEMHGVYQFEDMDILPDLHEEMRKERGQLYMSEGQRKSLLYLFRSLSVRERQCYVLYEAEKLSMAKIGEKLGLKKRTVQQYIERARQKVESVKESIS